MKVSGNQICLHFRQFDGGLVAADGTWLKGFEIVGGDRQFVTASAKIQGDIVQVWNDRIAHPMAVRLLLAEQSDLQPLQ
jgi:sialate O-acetylesterase